MNPLQSYFIVFINKTIDCESFFFFFFCFWAKLLTFGENYVRVIRQKAKSAVHDENQQIETAVRLQMAQR